MQGQTQEVAPTMTQNKKGTNTRGSAPFIFKSNALAFHHLHYRAIGFHRVYSCG